MQAFPDVDANKLLFCARAAETAERYDGTCGVRVACVCTRTVLSVSPLVMRFEHLLLVGQFRTVHSGPPMPKAGKHHRRF